MRLRFFISLLLSTLVFELVQSKSLVLVGVIGDNDIDIWNKIIELAGGVGVAKMGVITAASADPLGSAVYYEDMLMMYGASETYFVPVYEGNEAENSNPDVVANIQRMTGFIFGGGDQARVVACFYNEGRVESPALAAIREVYDLGAVISGTSAGLSCQPWAVMIMGGVSYDALVYGAFAFGTEQTTSDLVYDPLGGIGMMPGYVIDSHFSERGREGRVIRLIADTRGLSYGVQFGIGVDENTALVVTDVDTPAAVGEVIGLSGALVLDLSAAVVDDTSADFKISNILAHYLTGGDRITMTDRVVTFNTAWKSNLAGNEAYLTAVTSSDIFAGVLAGNDKSEFIRVGTSLFDASLATTTSGITRENKPEFEVRFTQQAYSIGYGGYSPDTGIWEISYTNLVIDITPI